MLNAKILKLREQNRRRVRKHRNIVSRYKSEIYNTQCRLQRTDNECIQRLEHVNMSKKMGSLNDQLMSWAQTHNVTQRAVSDLLKILISIGLTWLPMDARTLLRTPKNMEINEVANGKLWYHGIGSNLRKIFNGLNKNLDIKLNFNIDGLPLFKSSKYQFWPILANIHGFPKIQPFAVAIWCGIGKPSNVNDFLSTFVMEMKELLERGIEINNDHVQINVRSFICDTPARSFVKGVVYFNAHYGCQKCITKGKYFKRFKVMSYPQIDCERRTDESFRTKKQPKHHKMTTIIEELRGINMIEDFPTSDPLHLLELGIMKRCLLRWNYGTKSYRNKFKEQDLIEINNLLLQANREIPVEIHRAVRTFNCLREWKGTEYRSFLLYFGMIILKDYIASEEYIHFLKICCITKLCSSDFYIANVSSSNSLVDRLVESYIDGYINIYGEQSISSNVHNLSHITDDVRKFSNLNTISAYPFENFLYLMKRKISMCNKPLEQIARRFAEIALNQEANCFDPIFNSIQFQDQKFPIVINGKQVFETIKFANYCLSCRKFGDKWFYTKNNLIVEFSYCFGSGDKVEIHGHIIKTADNFFTVPLTSSKLFIFISNLEKENQITCGRDDIRCKMICLSYKNQYIFQPLVHTLQ